MIPGIGSQYLCSRLSENCLNVVVFVHERRIYGQQGSQVEVFAAGSDLAIDPVYVRSWLDLLGSTPRVAPFLGKNAPIIADLRKWLRNFDQRFGTLFKGQI